MMGFGFLVVLGFFLWCFRVWVLAFLWIDLGWGFDIVVLAGWICWLFLPCVGLV